METYSSDNVVGMTGIPACTIRRYIRDFRSFFSESAQQPNRGRRYTSDDMRKIQSIRHLYSERQSNEKIRAICLLLLHPIIQIDRLEISITSTQVLKRYLKCQ